MKTGFEMVPLTATNRIYSVTVSCFTLSYREATGFDIEQ